MNEAERRGWNDLTRGSCRGSLESGITGRKTRRGKETGVEG